MASHCGLSWVESVVLELAGSSSASVLDFSPRSVLLNHYSQE